MVAEQNACVTSRIALAWPAVIFACARYSGCRPERVHVPFVDDGAKHGAHCVHDLATSWRNPDPIIPNSGDSTCFRRTVVCPRPYDTLRSHIDGDVHLIREAREHSPFYLA